MLPVAALAFACGGGNENLPPPPPPPPPPPAAASEAPAPSAAPSASAARHAAPPPAPVQLVQGTASPDPAPPLPTVKILAPAKEQVIPAAKAGDFVVKLDVKNWQTATGSSHVHLILDDKPYKPIYDPKAPVKLSELPGGDALGEGQHILVAFPSRAEPREREDAGSALRSPSSGSARRATRTQDPNKPMLIYSRPKGEYKGDMANHVLVDFQLANDKLSPGGDHVHISVTGPGIEGEKAADATQFGPPFYLDNLQDGSYTVKLDLLGADGKRPPGLVELDDAHDHDRPLRRPPRQHLEQRRITRKLAAVDFLAIVLAATAAAELLRGAALRLRVRAEAGGPRVRGGGDALRRRGRARGRVAPRLARDRPGVGARGRARRRGSACSRSLPMAIHFALDYRGNRRAVAGARRARTRVAVVFVRRSTRAGASRSVAPACTGARRSGPAGVGRRARGDGGRRDGPRHRRARLPRRAGARRSPSSSGRPCSSRPTINDVGVASGAFTTGYLVDAGIARLRRRASRRRRAPATPPSRRSSSAARKELRTRTRELRRSYEELRDGAGGARQEGAARGRRRARGRHRARGAKPARDHLERRRRAAQAGHLARGPRHAARASWTRRPTASIAW